MAYSIIVYHYRWSRTVLVLVGSSNVLKSCHQDVDGSEGADRKRRNDRDAPTESKSSHKEHCMDPSYRRILPIMVSVKRNPKQWTLSQGTCCVTFVVSVLLITWIYGWVVIDDGDEFSMQGQRSASKHYANNISKCSIASISDLSDDELRPVAGSRHMITPPQGGKLSLVCCETTQGNMNLLLHKNWAPIGVARFLEMVESQYFQTRVPLFRCTDACQFGLAGDPEFTKRFNTRLQDDPMWLPPGANHRQNENGVKRYPQGFFTYAGSGNHSRSNQFVLTLKPNPFMGGGSPWEVPMGELVGKDSFQTISKFYTGYGEKGPSQGLLHREGASEKVQTQWPLLDYVTGCNLVDEMMLQD